MSDFGHSPTVCEPDPVTLCTRPVLLLFRPDEVITFKFDWTVKTLYTDIKHLSRCSPSLTCPGVSSPGVPSPLTQTLSQVQIILLAANMFHSYKDWLTGDSGGSSSVQVCPPPSPGSPGSTCRFGGVQQEKSKILFVLQRRDDVQHKDLNSFSVFSSDRKLATVSLAANRKLFNKGEEEAIGPTEPIRLKVKGQTHSSHQQGRG